jgi:hypothetical protein
MNITTLESFITALVVGIPAIIASVTALIVSLRGKTLAKAAIVTAISAKQAVTEHTEAGKYSAN